MRSAVWAVSAAALAGLATACSPSTGSDVPFDPRLYGRTEASAAANVRSIAPRPLPTTMQSPFQAVGPDGKKGPASKPDVPSDFDIRNARRLPLAEVMRRSMAGNGDIRVAAFSPAIEGTRVTEAEARFDPIWFSNFQFQRQDNKTTGSVIPDPSNPAATILVNEDRQNRTSFSNGFKQTLSTGAQVELKMDTDRTEVGPRRALINPSWTNQFQLQVTQPLLRDFGADVNRARIVVAQNNQRISMLEFRNSVEEQVQTIEQTYWDLYQAVKGVEIAELLLRRTLDTAWILNQRAAQGQDVTDAQTSQANSSVRSREADLIRSRARVRDLSDRLKRLMNDPSFPVSGDMILPADEPVIVPVRYELSDQLDTAMQNRYEIIQQYVRIDSANVIARVARNNLLPQLNLVAQTGVQGLNDNLGSAFSSNFNDGHWSYGVGLQLEIPLGNRSAEAIMQRSNLQKLQAVEQYKALVPRIAEEVTTARREVETSWAELEMRREAKFAAQSTLKAIEAREEKGIEALTPTFVQLKLNTQADLARAESAEVEAIRNYNVAITRLERSKGTLLRYNNILMEGIELPR